MATTGTNTHRSSRRETVIYVDGGKNIATYAGRPYTFATFEGDSIEGVTECLTRIIDKHGNVFQQLIVRFPDGTWAYPIVETF